MIVPIGILIADDFEPWRRYACAMIQTDKGLQVVGEVADGLDAVQRANELQPDLILLDIDLPGIDGLQAARNIRRSCPRSKILFASVESSPVMAREALRTGAHGYLVKSEAGKELISAVRAVAQDESFVSASLHLNGDASR